MVFKKISLVASSLALVMLLCSCNTEHNNNSVEQAKNSFTVSFNMLGHGEMVESIKEVKENSKITAPNPEPYEVGYTFEGWFKEENCLNEWDFDNDIVVNDLTLFAGWNAINYSVDFYTNDSEMSYLSIPYTYGETLVLPDETPTKVGYSFSGWFTSLYFSEEITKSSVVVITKSLNLYAKWTPLTFEVTFDSNGDSGGYQNTTIIQTYDDNYILPSKSPIKIGHEFTGWYTEKENGSRIDSTSIVKILSNITLFAHYRPISYQCIFYGNFENSEYKEELSFEYNSNLSFPKNNPEREGYTFSGWFTAKEGGTKLDENYIVKGFTKLYAQWSINKYTVTFACDFIKDDIDPLTDIEYNSLISEPLVQIGDEFNYVEGWYKDSEFSEKWDFSSTRVTGNVTLYPKVLSYYDDYIQIANEIFEYFENFVNNAFLSDDFKIRFCALGLKEFQACEANIFSAKNIDEMVFAKDDFLDEILILINDVRSSEFEYARAFYSSKCDLLYDAFIEKFSDFEYLDEMYFGNYQTEINNKASHFKNLLTTLSSISEIEAFFDDYEYDLNNIYENFVALEINEKKKEITNLINSSFSSAFSKISNLEIENTLKQNKLSELSNLKNTYLNKVENAIDVPDILSIYDEFSSLLAQLLQNLK